MFSLASKVFRYASSLGSAGKTIYLDISELTGLNASRKVYLSRSILTSPNVSSKVDIHIPLDTFNVSDGKASKGALKLPDEDKLKLKLDLEEYLYVADNRFSIGSKLDIKSDSDAAGNRFNSGSSSRYRNFKRTAEEITREKSTILKDDMDLLNIIKLATLMYCETVWSESKFEVLCLTDVNKQLSNTYNVARKLRKI